MHDLGFKKRKKVALNYTSLPLPLPFVALWHTALSGSDSILILKWIPFFHVCGYSSRSLCCKYQKVILLNHLLFVLFFYSKRQKQRQNTSWHCLAKQRANLLFCLLFIEYLSYELKHFFAHSRHCSCMFAFMAIRFGFAI